MVWAQTPQLPFIQVASPENRNFLIHSRNHCIPQREPKQKWLKYQALKVKPSVKPTTVLKKKGFV
jgi:hypothetical protein